MHVLYFINKSAQLFFILMWTIIAVFWFIKSGKASSEIVSEILFNRALICIAIAAIILSSL